MLMPTKIIILSFFLSLLPGLSAEVGMVQIPGGYYKPLYLDKKEGKKEKVGTFWLDVYPVTDREFSEFVSANPSWSPEGISRLAAEADYLQHWKKNPSFGSSASPVVNVSWFSARAYCRWKKKRLPSVSEWEYAAMADETRKDASRDTVFLKRIMNWYSKPNSPKLNIVGTGYRNLYGIYDMHGQIWEWTDDFSSAIVSGDSRNDSSLDKGMFCGSGALGADDFGNYAAFLRYGLRSSLKANYALSNLGFRCAR